MSRDLKSVIKDINKKYKREIITKGVQYENTEMIPFLSPRLNYMLYGGFPKGKAIELFGTEGGGKTTTALIAVGQFQKKYPDKKVAFIDLENTLDDKWAKLNGVDIEDLVMLRPNDQTAEEILQIVIDMVSTGEISLVVLDSIPMLVPKQLYEQDIEKKAFGGVSIPVSEFCRRVSPKLFDTSTTLILINQIRDNLGNPWDIYYTPGGRALKHLCALRLYFRKGSFIDDDCNELNNSVEEPDGNMVDIRVIKNKCSRNDRRLGQYTLNYKKGIDVLNDTVYLAIKYDLIVQKGPWFYVHLDDEELKFQGRPKLLNYLKENKKVFNDIYDKINELVSVQEDLTGVDENEYEQIGEVDKEEY
jgi:recombination protein RecA